MSEIQKMDGDEFFPDNTIFFVVCDIYTFCYDLWAALIIN